jgi:hypothetical protein
MALVSLLAIPKALFYYHFFAKTKLKQLKENHLFSCRKVAHFLIYPIVMIIFYTIFVLIIVTELILQQKLDYNDPS